MLSPTRVAATFSASHIGCAYRAVVAIFRWPSSFQMVGRPSPSAGAREAQEWRQSCSRTSSSPAFS